MGAEAEILRRIDRGGPISFAEFMEVALYWPGGGYYSSGNPIAGEGDYYTSPLVHPCFGAALALQLFQMWQLLERPMRFTVIEWGAGSGLLCRDALLYAAALPEGFYDSLEYVCVDRRESGGHEQGLASACRLIAEGLPLRGAVGCVLSNELLDAFPVHQVTMQGGELREVFVASEGGELAYSLGEPSTPGLAERLNDLDVTLIEGQTAEINLGLNAWAEQIAAALNRGFVLTIDYGRPARDLYSAAERMQGTLTTFHRHLQTDAPLERVGRQDISAQVDFTSVVRAGREAGLDYIGAAPQGVFLQNLGLPEMLEQIRDKVSSRTEYVANRAGLLELAKPGGLGAFQVLLQGKGVREAELWGLVRSDEASGLAQALPAPTLTPRHLTLSGGWRLG